MDPAPSPRHAPALACLTAVAIAGVLLMLSTGGSPDGVARGLVSGLSFLVAGGVIWLSAPGSSWPGLRPIAPPPWRRRFVAG